MANNSKQNTNTKEEPIMAARVKRKKIDFKDKVVNIGIDMHKRSWRITALVEGDIVMAVTLARPKYDSFKKLLAQFEGNAIRVVYEAGPGGFDLYDRLTSDGIDCIVTPPSLIPTESGNRVKTDKKDSYKLAKLLESNMLKNNITTPVVFLPKQVILGHAVALKISMTYRLQAIACHSHGGPSSQARSWSC